jgi:phosphoribosylaminoimidazole-succinocarboxamide synthase
MSVPTPAPGSGPAGSHQGPAGSPAPGSPALRVSTLPLPLLHRGKVREMYDAGDGLLLMVASDRVSAFDVVMEEPVPRKGEVLTLLTAWWLDRLPALLGEMEDTGVGGAGSGPLPPFRHHAVAARPEEIRARVPVLRDPALAPHWERRALLVRRTEPLPVECVVRGYLSGSAWKEYRDGGTLAGEPLPPGLTEAERLPAPLFSPATKAVSGHDENIPYQGVVDRVGAPVAEALRSLSLALYGVGARVAGERGIVLADTKFEFGVDPEGELVLIDEVMTPDSSRYWPRESYRPGTNPPSLDKQPVRDFLDALPDWDHTPPPPPLPEEVLEAATARYLEIFRRLTGVELDGYEPPSFAPPSFPATAGGGHP